MILNLVAPNHTATDRITAGTLWQRIISGILDGLPAPTMVDVSTAGLAVLLFDHHGAPDPWIVRLSPDYMPEDHGDTIIEGRPHAAESIDYHGWKITLVRPYD